MIKIVLKLKSGDQSSSRVVGRKSVKINLPKLEQNQQATRANLKMQLLKPKKSRVQR